MDTENINARTIKCGWKNKQSREKKDVIRMSEWQWGRDGDQGRYKQTVSLKRKGRRTYIHFIKKMTIVWFG